MNREDAKGTEPHEEPARVWDRADGIAVFCGWCNKSVLTVCGEPRNGEALVRCLVCGTVLARGTAEAMRERFVAPRDVPVETESSAPTVEEEYYRQVERPGMGI